MFDWAKLYIRKGNNKLAGTFFEELAISYLSSTYKQYSWEKTKSSWDGNRDFTSIILDNIWGEAKYKKNSTSLRRQDIDPTMISGFLDGKVKLVFIITNGTIPHTINNRMNEVGRKCGFNVIGITRKQLEYWLIIHPEKYEYFFGEKLSHTEIEEAVCIEDITLTSRLDAHFVSSYTEAEFICGDIYDLKITLSCNTKEKVIIKENLDYPLTFLEDTTFSLDPGLHQRHVLVKLVRTNTEPITLEFQLQNGSILRYALDVKIICNKNPQIVYSQQEKIKIEIYRTLQNLPNDVAHLIFLKGKLGYGKTFLMKELAKEFSSLYVVHVIQCENLYYPGINSVKLCRAIMFINYGFIFEHGDKNFYTSYKYLLLKNNIDNILSDNLLEDFFDGCIDPAIAQKTILFLSKNKLVRIIKNSRFARRHILFLDDIHIFTKEEKTVFNMILLQLKNGYSNSILLFSGEYFKSNKYILSYELKGMNTDDIIESLKANLIDMTYLSYKSTILSMPKQPQLLSELILFIQNNSQSKLPANNINNYILQITNNHLTNLDFDLLKEEKAIINIIYHFQKGVSKKLLHALKFNESTLDSLCTRGYLISYDNRYLPCYDYFYYTYLNTNAQIQPDKKMASILHLMLRNFSLDPLLDTIQVQALLIQYDIDMYKNLKIEFKEKITEYINKGYYKKAMLYGEIFCFDMLSRPSSSNNALEALFYFGISLIHCDSQRRAIDVFSYIKNNTPKDSILYLRASAELINNKYSRFEIEDLIEIAIALKYDLSNCIQKIYDENNLTSQQIRIAYSTCMNRIMMIYFLVGNYDLAKQYYDDYHKYHLSIPKCRYSSKYDSMLLEWDMDYARGIGIQNPQMALKLEKNCFKNFSAHIDYRRKTLSEIDIIFLQAILEKDYNNAIQELERLENDLKKHGIFSEAFKASIRKAYCHLLKYISIPEFSKLSQLNPFVDDIYTELFQGQLDAHLIVHGRTSYLLNNLLAVLYIIKTDIRQASEILQKNLDIIYLCTGEYCKIINHNLHNVNEIEYVDWYFKNKTMYPNTYYLDIRVW